MLTAKQIVRNSLKRAGYKVRDENRLALDLPVLRPDQQIIVDHAARFKVLACGRRWGKTMLDIRLLADKALAGETWGYFSMTYRNLSECYRALKDALIPMTSKAIHNERIELNTGGVLEFWSMQTSTANTARGRKYHGIVVDEAAYIPNGDYVWNGVIRPTLADYNGQAILTSTPNGRNHFWQWYMRGRDPHNSDWHSWTFPTSANPVITEDEMTAIESETPSLYFKQEYLAEFLENEGSVFRRIIENATLIESEQKPFSNHRYVFGVDWAMQNDFTVIAVMDSNTHELVALDRFNGVNWSLQRGRILALAEKWRPKVIYAESNSIGSPNIEALQAEGLPVRPFETTAASKPPLIESLVLAFERDEIKILDHDVLKGELMAYERNVTSTGRSQYSAPVGMHDDCVIALALAWKGCVSAGVTLATAKFLELE